MSTFPALFAQSTAAPLDRSSVLEGKYSNINSSSGNRDASADPFQSFSSEIDFSPKLMMPPMDGEADKAIKRLIAGEPRPLRSPESSDIRKKTRTTSSLFFHSTTSDTASSSHPQISTIDRVSPSREIELDEIAEALLYDRVSRSSLSNGGNDCFINSSLQLLKSIGVPSFITMPNLAKFLNNEVKTDKDCRALRLEMANQVMAGTQEFDSQPTSVEPNPNNVVKKINECGTAVFQQDVSAFLLRLLEKVEVPQATFTETLTNQEQAEAPRIVQQKETLFPLTLPSLKEGMNSLTIQDILDCNLTLEFQMKWNDGDLNKTKVNQTRQLINPAPTSLVVSIGRFDFNDGRVIKRNDTIQGVLNSITFPLINGQLVIYQPNAIICHLGDSVNNGHYICYRKEGNIWWKFDDAIVSKATYEEDNETIHKNCYIVSYIKTDAASVREPWLTLPRNTEDRDIVAPEEIDFSHLIKSEKIDIPFEEKKANESITDHQITMPHVEAATKPKTVLKWNREVELQSIQDQIEELQRCSLENKAKKDTSSDSFEQWELEQSITMFNEASEYLDNAKRVIPLGMSDDTAFVLWKEAASLSKASAEQYMASAQIWIQGAIDEAKQLDTHADILLGQARSAKYLAKANEAEKNGNKELAEKWNEVAGKNQQAVEFLNQAIIAYASGRQVEGKNWNNAGGVFYKVADILDKAIEIETTAKPELALKWREVAQKKECSANPYAQAAKAYHEEETGEGSRWVFIGDTFYWISEKLEKAIEAERVGNLEEAQKWREAAELQVSSVEFYIQSLKACEQAAKTYQPIKKEEGYVWYLAADCLTKAASKLVKAIEAERVGNLEEAEKWCEVAEQYKNSVKPYTKLAKDFEQKNSYWESAGNNFRLVAERLEKAIEAENINKPEVAQKWREVAEQNKYAAECHTEAAEDRDQGQSKGIYVYQSKGVYALNIAGKEFDKSAEKLAGAIEAEGANKPEIAQKWREVAEHNKCSAEFFYKGARAQKEGKEKEGCNWRIAGDASIKAVEKLEKAINAEGDNKSEIAQKWREAAGQEIIATEFYIQAAISYKEGKDDEGIYLQKAAQSTHHIAARLERIIEEEIRGNSTIIQSFKEQVANFQKSVAEYMGKVEELQKQKASTEAAYIAKEQADIEEKRDI
ncbi:MAG TPA: hypothetical protein VJK54_10795 [Chthoniobacterales bacterium]|nr:hypothetical protein [Chthoniobacterales bacterium]